MIKFHLKWSAFSSDTFQMPLFVWYEKILWAHKRNVYVWYQEIKFWSTHKVTMFGHWMMTPPWWRNVHFNSTLSNSSNSVSHLKFWPNLWLSSYSCYIYFDIWTNLLPGKYNIIHNWTQYIDIHWEVPLDLMHCNCKVYVSIECWEHVLDLRPISSVFLPTVDWRRSGGACFSYWRLFKFFN